MVWASSECVTISSLNGNIWRKWPLNSSSPLNPPSDRDEVGPWFGPIPWDTHPCPPVYESFTPWAVRQTERWMCFPGLLCCSSGLTMDESQAKEDCRLRAVLTDPRSRRLTLRKWEARRQWGVHIDRSPEVRSHRGSLSLGLSSPCFSKWGLRAGNQGITWKLLESQTPPQTCRTRVCIFSRFPGILWMNQKKKLHWKNLTKEMKFLICRGL